jgi:uncharacterized protein YndB with AHSA1/START domain
VGGDGFDRFFEPIRKSVVVPGTPAETFALFTAIGTWWPLAGYSVFRERAVSCGIEPRAGGALYEVRDDGERCVWGRVLDWSPPDRLVLSWHPGLPAEDAQQVEVRFTEVAGGTRVDLEHREWAALAERASRIRGRYEPGWSAILGRFAAGSAHATRRD